MKKLLILIAISSSFLFAKKFEGKVKHVSLLSDFNVIEIESNINSYETLYIRKDRNFKIEKGNKVHGNCVDKDIKDGEYTNCLIIKDL